MPIWPHAPRALPDSASDDAFELVTLPHANITLPLRNFEQPGIPVYPRLTALPPRRKLRQGRRRHRLRRGDDRQHGIDQRATLGDHDGGYVPFSFDLTDHLREGENTIQVRLDFGRAGLTSRRMRPSGRLSDLRRASTAT
ncbi:MAG: hypothetical protein IPK19_24150, partial [Chloroflexi bacterium]|nr:hypothetical protein [Chloroflexota bacterium]